MIVNREEELQARVVRWSEESMFWRDKWLDLVMKRVESINQIRTDLMQLRSTVENVAKREREHAWHESE